jgi:SWI/SNF-related matrix-associated actin-dependent regulator of chromatin subfamily A member 5
LSHDDDQVYQLICRGSVEDQMLDRIRRKLFLSLKVMGSDNAATTENSTLGYSEVMDILRKGSSALSSVDDGMSLARFLDANIEDVLNESRSREIAREAKMKNELGGNAQSKQDGQSDTRLLEDAEEEKRLLSGIAQVKCRLFEGKMVSHVQDNKGIAKEWRDLQKRAKVDQIIMVDDAPVLAARMGPEIVRELEIGMLMMLTLSFQVSTDNKSAQKRKKAKFEWEDWCIYCRDGGELFLCNHCPRGKSNRSTLIRSIVSSLPVFHAKCHGVPNPKGFVVCSQHACSLCGRLTSQAGGMLFRYQCCFRRLPG